MSHRLHIGGGHLGYLFCHRQYPAVYVVLVAEKGVGELLHFSVRDIRVNVPVHDARL